MSIESKPLKEILNILKKDNIVNVSHIISDQNIICLVQRRFQKSDMVYLKILQNNTKGILAESINKRIWKIEIRKLSVYFSVSLIGTSEQNPEWLL